MKPTAFCTFFGLLLFLPSLSFAVSAYNSSFDFRVGYFNPTDTKSGWILGAQYGRAVDQRVNFGFSVDFYQQEYKKRVKIAGSHPSGIDSHWSSIQTEFHTLLVPFMFNLSINLPVSQFLVNPYLNLGIGYQWLRNKEQDHENNSSRTRNYGGFGWSLAGGLLYPLGSRSDLIGELFWNDATVSRSAGRKEGLPIEEEIGVSGLGVRLGIRIY
ncbi:MAG: hypothetical protein D6675_02835 [Gemmatimonadetes bacterium]|nr:MAG: hypothetical protein D6675_02835 [Gemmatimonadota bacterium]